MSLLPPRLYLQQVAVRSTFGRSSILFSDFSANSYSLHYCVLSRNSNEFLIGEWLMAGHWQGIWLLVGLIPLDGSGEHELWGRKTGKVEAAGNEGWELFSAALAAEVVIPQVWITDCRYVSCPFEFVIFSDPELLHGQPVTVDVKLWFEAEAGVLASVPEAPILIRMSDYRLPWPRRRWRSSTTARKSSGGIHFFS